MMMKMRKDDVVVVEEGGCGKVDVGRVECWYWGGV